MYRVVQAVCCPSIWRCAASGCLGHNWPNAARLPRLLPHFSHWARLRVLWNWVHLEAGAEIHRFGLQLWRSSATSIAERPLEVCSKTRACGNIVSFLAHPLLQDEFEIMSFIEIMWKLMLYHNFDNGPNIKIKKGTCWRNGKLNKSGNSNFTHCTWVAVYHQPMTNVIFTFLSKQWIICV